ALASMASFDVQPQPVSTGVRDFARQAGIEVLVSGDLAEGRSINAVQGTLDTREALGRLVAGTGLAVQSFDDGVAVLGAAAAQEAVAAVSAEPAGQDQATMLDSVVVTGSRIARPELVNPMPVSVVEMETAARFGHTDLY